MCFSKKIRNAAYQSYIVSGRGFDGCDGRVFHYEMRMGYLLHIAFEARSFCVATEFPEDPE